MNYPKNKTQLRQFFRDKKGMKMTHNGEMIEYVNGVESKREIRSSSMLVVDKGQTNAVAFRTEEGKRVWTYFESEHKAGKVAYEFSEDGFVRHYEERTETGELRLSIRSVYQYVRSSSDDSSSSSPTDREYIPEVFDCGGCGQPIHVMVPNDPEYDDPEYLCQRCGGGWERVEDRWTKVICRVTEQAAINYANRHQQEYSQQLKVGMHSSDGYVVYYDQKEIA